MVGADVGASAARCRPSAFRWCPKDVEAIVRQCCSRGEGVLTVLLSPFYSALDTLASVPRKGLSDLVACYGIILGFLIGSSVCLLSAAFISSRHLSVCGSWVIF